MHNKKIISNGLIIATTLVNIPIDSMAASINYYTDTKEESTKSKEIREKAFILKKSAITSNRNIIEGSVLEISLTDGENVPDLTGNPDGYEAIRVTTTGNKKIVAKDYTNLKESGIPKIDLSNAKSDSIPASAFANHAVLEEFIFPQGITTIGFAAFSGCSGLTGGLAIPDSVIRIESYAFMNCVGFNSLTLGKSLEFIGNTGFAGCSGFKGDLVIPNSVTYIDSFAFQGCSGFTGDLIIPNSVTTIGGFVFRGCSGFDGKLVLPDAITKIDNYTFFGCDGFTGDLVIPDTVTSIGSYAFSGCSGFDGVLVIPDALTNINDYAFNACSRFSNDLIIPNTVTSIGRNAFGGYNSAYKILVKVDNSDLDTNYREEVIKNLSDTSQTVIDIPYDFDVSGTWLETTRKTVGKPVIKNVVDGIESDLTESKGETVSLYIPSLYQESNITVLKDRKLSRLPVKDSNGKHVFTEPGVYEVTITTDLGNTSIVTFEVEDPRFKIAEEAVEKSEISKGATDVEDARDLVNNLPESMVKDQLQDRLDNLFPNLELEKKSATVNFDVYVKSENMLSMSLDTNSITFEDYSGVEDTEMLGALNISINSSLPYSLNVYLPSEITNNDKSNILPIDILNIRESSESDYKQFANTTDKVILKYGCAKGNDKVHTIDLKLASNQAHKADVYKTVIKFEAEQK